MTGTSIVNRRLLALVSAAVFTVGLGGCATTSELNSLKDRVDAAEADASAARAEASAARQEAAEARTLAGQAMSAATDAQATADESPTKIDRMIKKAMYK